MRRRGEGAAASGLTGAADRARGRRAAEAAAARRTLLEVTSVTVLPAEEEPAETLDGEPGDGTGGETASDWLPGIRDEHEDDGGWQARLAGPADLGSDRHAEHPPADGPAPRTFGAPGALTARRHEAASQAASCLVSGHMSAR